MDGAEREAIARQLAEHLAERYGVAVAVALHQPSEQGDERNHHAHILMTTRRMEADGLGAKTRELDDKRPAGRKSAIFGSMLVT
ncbi:MobA/MobL family protein [Methylomagnum ishizawai]|uniref:MobA/MobL family protein n=1 Tax=Methylomagnum ishizawai TaxID=1760988 RepID=UPI000A153901|nr:MobA/MobL family protein [Methylomagnum ishizawai]